jgi:hypothetical protein
MKYKIEVVVENGQAWKHNVSGRLYRVVGTLLDEIQLERGGESTSESPQFFIENYRKVTPR